MSRPTSRLLATTSSQLSTFHRSPPALQLLRPFSQTCRRQDEPPKRLSLLQGLSRGRKTAMSAEPKREPDMSDIGRLLGRDLVMNTMAASRNRPAEGDEPSEPAAGDLAAQGEPYHFHIYAHKHNSHITVTRPNRNPIISLSAGNIGFKKSKRGTYDAAYQLTAFALDKLNQMGMHREITTLEVVLRGFGSGREAAVKVLLGNEGRLLRGKVVKVADATRVKFGGTRSPAPRRLG